MKCLRISNAIVRIFFYQAIVFVKKKIYFCGKKTNIMLQRIQTIYLFIAFIIMGILPFLFPLETDASGNKQIFAMDHTVDFALFLGSAALSFITIFLFKNRQLQFVLCRLNIILNLILLGLFVYHSLSVSGGVATPEKGIGMFLPIFSIVFLVLANKAIKKDEDLVKSVDRLR